MSCNLPTVANLCSNLGCTNGMRTNAGLAGKVSKGETEGVGLQSRGLYNVSAHSHVRHGSTLRAGACNDRFTTPLFLRLCSRGINCSPFFCCRVPEGVISARRGDIFLYLGGIRMAGVLSTTEHPCNSFLAAMTEQGCICG